MRITARRTKSHLEVGVVLSSMARPGQTEVQDPERVLPPLVQDELRRLGKSMFSIKAPPHHPALTSCQAEAWRLRTSCWGPTEAPLPPRPRRPRCPARLEPWLERQP